MSSKQPINTSNKQPINIPEGIRAKGEVLYVLRGGLFWIQVIQDEHLQTKGGQKGGKKERRKEGKKERRKE